MRVSCILLFIAALTFSGCCTSRGDLFVSGSIVASIVDGQFRPSNASAATAFYLKAAGDTFRVADRAVFRLTIADNVNLGATTIRVDSLNDVTAGSRRVMYRGTLVETCNARVNLDTKCQRVRWYNPYTLPEVTVSEDYPHQVVITPIVSANCKRIGYEIRLGDTRVDGCESPALDALGGCRQSRSKEFVRTPPPPRGSRVGLGDLLF